MSTGLLADELEPMLVDGCGLHWPPPPPRPCRLPLRLLSRRSTRCHWTTPVASRAISIPRLRPHIGHSNLAEVTSRFPLKHCSMKTTDSRGRRMNKLTSMETETSTNSSSS